MEKINISSCRLLIRDVEKEDVSYINNMYKDLDFYFYAIGSHTNLSEKYYEQFIQQDKVCPFFCVAKHMETSNFVGCIRGYIYYGKRKILWITSLMIDKNFCRKGYGTELVDEIIKYFKIKSDIEYVSMSVAEKNEIGKKFWTKLGFSVIKVIPRHDAKKLIFGDISIYGRNA